MVRNGRNISTDILHQHQKAGLLPILKAETLYFSLINTVFSVLLRMVQDLSQGKAAEIAGLNRAEFINILVRYKVSTFQYTTQELAEEIADLDE